MNDSINDALIECVKAAGGSHIVGHKIWPEAGQQQAQRKLLDCLNPDRPQHLTPEQMLLILRLARERGCHVGMAYIAQSLGYTEPSPITPKDEADELQRQYIEAARSMAKIAERIESIHRPALRAA